MIEAINFSQFFGFFGLFGREKSNTPERKLSRELIKDARKLAEKAETEAQNAAKAKKLTLTAEEQELKQTLAQIAIWHHETSAKNYRQAAARYSEASKIRADQKSILQRRVEEIIRLAEKSEQNINFLRSFIN